MRPASASELSASNLEAVLGLCFLTRSIKEEATSTPEDAAGAAEREIKRSILQIQKARHPRAHKVHRRSHEALLRAEQDWEKDIRGLLQQLLGQSDVGAAFEEARQGWQEPPGEPPDGVLVGSVTPGSALTRRLRKRLSAAKGSDLDLIQNWGGKAAEMAQQAIETGEAVTVRDAAGEPTAVATYRTTKGHLVVDRLSVRPGSTGRTMLHELAKQASADGLGLRVYAETKAQRAYFKDLGMKSGANGYFWTPKQTNEFVQTEGYKPPAAQTVISALTATMNEEAFLTGGVQVYLGLSLKTSETAGQISLDHLGLNRTFAWAHPENMANDLFSVRGSKVVQQMYGDHGEALSKIIIEATDPRHPLALSEVQSKIRSMWPDLERYQAERIARTETAAVWTTTSANAYAANGIAQFQTIVATGPSIGVQSEDPCDECIDLAAEVFEITDDLPPWHPNCRCEAIPVLEGADGEPWLPPAEPWAGSELPVEEGADYGEGHLVPARDPEVSPRYRRAEN